MVRKHLYLVTEHNNPDRVGCVKIFESKMSRPQKNNEAPITKLDRDEKDFRDVGKMVCIGYVDCEGEDSWEENAGDLIKEKLTEIDSEWLEKAGVTEFVENK